MGTNGGETNKEFFVDGPRVVEQGSDDTLDAFDARVVELRRTIDAGRKLLIGLVDDCTVLVGGQRRLYRGCVPLMEEQVGDVFIHGEAACPFAVAICVVPT